MALVATLLSPQQLERLRLATGDRYAIAECVSWDAVARLCDARPVQLAVVDLYADGTPNFERVRELKRHFPTLSIVAYVAPSLDRLHDLFDAGRVGVDGLVLVDVDDAADVLRTRLEQAEARGLTTLLRRELGTRSFHPLVRDALLVAVVRAHERLSPADLARILAAPTRALARRLTDAKLPPPNKLLIWGRLLVAARLLESGTRSADRVAQTLAFPSGSAFRNAARRYLDASPGEIRGRGGARWVIGLLLDGAHDAADEPAPGDEATEPAAADV